MLHLFSSFENGCCQHKMHTRTTRYTRNKVYLKTWKKVVESKKRNNEKKSLNQI